ncbi:uncharacterized protein LOC144662966 [Oculina patagonica]
MASHMLFLFVLISTWLVFTTSKTLCPRIFFQNINEETMPYKMIEGVYIKQNDSYNNFPVFRRESDSDLRLYYHIDKKSNKLLVFGNNFGDGSFFQFGVASRLSSDPLSWLSSGTLNKSDVFSGLVQQWQYYNKRDQTDYNVPTTASSPMIKAVCVDEDFRECNSDRVYLNELFDDKNGTILNDPTTDYFHRVEGLFRNLRPVYKHSAVSWYLQYVESYWVISESYRPSNSEENVILRVKDLAIRPEYITKTWSQWSAGWRDMPNLRVFCRGVTSMSNICPSNPCYNNATCVYTSGNETLCLCTSGFTGTKCSVNKQCPTPHPEASTEHGLKYLEKRPGNLLVSFCRGSPPSTRFYLCVDSDDNSSWSGQGSRCRENEEKKEETTQSSTTNWDILVIAISLLVVMVFSLLIIQLFYLRRQSVKEADRRMEQVVYYRSIFDEINDRRVKLDVNIRSWGRTTSMEVYFSFYLWLFFLIYSHVASQEPLRIFAIVMLCLSYMIVLIESFFCEELEYLKNIIEDESASEYIQRMHDVPPKINMVVECYHLGMTAEGFSYDIVTYSDRDVFSFDSWDDVSEREMPSNTALMRVKIDSSIQFGDQETTDCYDREVAEIYRRNFERDHKINMIKYSPIKEVPGVNKRFSAYADLSMKPFWIRPLFFWIATLLYMSWPYRWLFRAKTAKIYYVLKKKVYKRQVSEPRRLDLTNLIAFERFRGDLPRQWII